MTSGDGPVFAGRYSLSRHPKTVRKREEKATRRAAMAAASNRTADVAPAPNEKMLRRALNYFGGRLALLQVGRRWMVIEPGTRRVIGCGLSRRSALRASLTGSR